MPGATAMRSPAGLELLGRARIVGWPTLATPWNTVSTKLGLAFVPNLALKIWMQCGPHCGVAAVAGSVPTVLRPPATVNIAAVASTLRLWDMSSSFRKPQPCSARRLCWQMDQARADAASPAAGRAVLGIMRPEGCSPGRPVPYGARNAVSAASVSSGRFLGDPVGAARSDQGLHRRRAS